MPTLRKRQTTLSAQLDALETELHDAETYLELADTLEGFLGRLTDGLDQLNIDEQQRILRLVVREVRIGGDDDNDHDPPLDPHPDRPRVTQVTYCVGAVLSPLLANIALSALDDHSPARGKRWGQRRAAQTRRKRGQATYRLVRYADDFVIRVAGERRHAKALIAQTAAPDRAARANAVAGEDPGHPHRGGDRVPRLALKRKLGRRRPPAVYTYPSKRSLAAVMAEDQGRSRRNGHNQTLDQLAAPAQPGAPRLVRLLPLRESKRTFKYLAPTRGGGS